MSIYCVCALDIYFEQLGMDIVGYGSSNDTDEEKKQSSSVFDIALH